MTWTVALDLVMAVLLAGSIFTTIVLDRRLRNLRGDNAQLQQLTDDFREATDRADRGLSGLKVSAHVLQERIDTARSLADDLQFLIERGDGLADRLESGVREARHPESRAQSLASGPTQSAGRASARGTGGGRGLAGSRGAAPGRGATEGGSPPSPRSAAELHLLAAMRAHG